MNLINRTVINLVSKFYTSCSHPQTAFYFRLVYGIIVIHFSIYAIALARYEFKVFSLNYKIANVITLSEGRYKTSALHKITSLSKGKIPEEPLIYNIFSSIRALLPQFDSFSYDNCKELNNLLAHYKSDLTDVNLTKFIFCGDKRKKIDNLLLDSDGFNSKNLNFADSIFTRVDLSKAILRDNFFLNSNFSDVVFNSADMSGADFAYTSFVRCDFFQAKLRQSNLCGVKFTDAKSFQGADFSDSNLVSADLAFLSLNDLSEMKLQNAYYNSEILNFNTESSDKQIYFMAHEFPRCLRDHPILPPTKFPDGFNPKEHGMIDISKL